MKKILNFEEKKKANIRLMRMYKQLKMTQKAKYIFNCHSLFIPRANGHYIPRYTCKDKFCSFCREKKRALNTLIYSQTFKTIFNQPEYDFYFLTIKANTCNIKNLKMHINWLNASLIKFKNYKYVKNVLAGYAKFLEIGFYKYTRGLENTYMTCDPHFHIILVVKKDQINNCSVNQLENNFQKAWEKSLIVSSSTKHKVYFDTIKSKLKPDLKLERINTNKDDKSKLNSISRVINYSMKPLGMGKNKYLQFDLTNFEILSKQLYGVRLISDCGIVKSEKSIIKANRKLTYKNKNKELSNCSPVIYQYAKCANTGKYKFIKIDNKKI